MCGCAKHGNRKAECTCICPEHGNYQLAYDLAMSRYDVILALQSEVKRLADALQAVTVPTENERERVRLIVAESIGGGNIRLGAIASVTDALIAAGFRLPVPVEPASTNAEYRTQVHAEIRRTLELFTPAVSKTVVRTVADAVLAIESPAVPVEPEWEYGFSADGGTVVERAFGIIPFETAEAAEHTGSKFFERTLDIVRRTKGVPAGEWQPVAPNESEGTES